MLNILCVTNGDTHAERFVKTMREQADLLGAELVLGLDGKAARGLGQYADTAINLKSAGYLESVLEQAIGACKGEYIFRLDDDERISPALLDWLESGEYAGGDVYAFPRPYLIGDERHMVVELYPDLQTRLTTRAKAGGRAAIHQGSPYGTGRIIPYAIEHHKLLVKTLKQREEIARRYESVRTGAGYSDIYGMYNLPERYIAGMTVAEYTDGDYRAR